MHGSVEARLASCRGIDWRQRSHRPGCIRKGRTSGSPPPLCIFGFIPPLVFPAPRIQCAVSAALHLSSTSGFVATATKLRRQATNRLETSRRYSATFDFASRGELTRHPMVLACVRMGSVGAHSCARNRANAASVVSDTWCSIPSASDSAASNGTPTASSRSTTTRCRARTLAARLSPASVRNTPAVGLGDRQSLALQAADRLDRGRVRHAQSAGDIGRPSLAAIGEKVGDQLDIVLQQRAGLGGPRLAEAACLRRLLREDRTSANGVFHHQARHVRSPSQGLPNCRNFATAG